MIVLDEQISRRSVREGFSWYVGQVAFLRECRPTGVIKDDLVPVILRKLRQPTFVTINVVHFWRRLEADRRYCLLCLPLAHERVWAVPELVRRLFQRDGLRTKAARCGTVVLAHPKGARCYDTADRRARALA